jgi:hypothetical protein
VSAAGVVVLISRVVTDDRLRATVSGSFRRAMSAVQEAVYALTDLGVDVLSPADPRVVAQLDDFLFVASDRLRTIKPVQNRHLAAIAASDFLWVGLPDGYIGPSVAMEIGYATAMRTPIYSDGTPDDVTLMHYVSTVSSISDAIHRCRLSLLPRRRDAVLLDPRGVVEAAHDHLNVILDNLTQPAGASSDLREAAAEIEQRIIVPLS